MSADNSPSKVMEGRNNEDADSSDDADGSQLPSFTVHDSDEAEEVAASPPSPPF